LGSLRQSTLLEATDNLSPPRRRGRRTTTITTMTDEHSDQAMTGGVNEVTRVGATVRRPAGPWTPAVHALLAHLADRGFTGAPRAHGIDQQGREIVDFIEGEVPDYPLPGWAVEDVAVRAVGELLRDFHDATTDFVSPPQARWYFPPCRPEEVVCHGDVAPYNTVFRNGRPAALIDFDTAHPGPRVWDVAYAAYRFVPLTAPSNAEFHVSLEEQCRRVRILADAYGLDAGQRAVLTQTAAARLRHLVTHIREQAAGGHEAFAAHLGAGHDSLYLADADYLDHHHGRFLSALS
jgi:aminoglycoside phosphotransferase (APT) family kinase protein